MFSNFLPVLVALVLIVRLPWLLLEGSGMGIRAVLVRRCVSVSSFVTPASHALSAPSPKGKRAWCELN